MIWCFNQPLSTAKISVLQLLLFWDESHSRSVELNMGIYTLSTSALIWRFTCVCVCGFLRIKEALPLKITHETLTPIWKLSHNSTDMTCTFLVKSSSSYESETVEQRRSPFRYVTFHSLFGWNFRKFQFPTYSKHAFNTQTHKIISKLVHIWKNGKPKSAITTNDKMHENCYSKNAV